MSKFPDYGPSIFSVMSKMANDYQAVNLSQGFPDFPVDPHLINIVSAIARENIHQYMPFSGYPPLLEKIAKLTLDSYNLTINPASEIVITAGATQAIFTAIQALVNPDDEVIVLDPSYDCYITPITLVNAKAVRIPLCNDFSPDWTAIAAAMNAKTKMLIINNPHNPSGRIWKESDFSTLEKLLDLFPEIIVLSDEVYEYICFEQAHISVNQRKKLRDRSIVVSSFGKSFHITGWKIGYMIAPENIMDELKKVHQYLVFSVNSIAQVAIDRYLDQMIIESLSPFYKKKRDYFRGLLSQSKLDLLPCEGTYFQLASYANLSDENDMDFTANLVKKNGVAAIPLSVFYDQQTDNKLIRFCFAKNEKTLEIAAERLLRL